MLCIGISPELARLSAEQALPAPQSGYRAPEENLARIEQLFRKWDRGLFGSRPYYRRQLRQCLMDSIGKEIITGRNYLDIYPEAGNTPVFRCSFREYRWLQIRGPINPKSIELLTGGDTSRLRRWWRSTQLLMIQGKIKRFRLADGPERGVVIQLEKITFL